jgi:hypothetical protein
LREKSKKKSRKESALKVFSLVILLSFFFVACKRNTVDPLDLKHEYFPTTIGNWVIYDVTEIQHDINHDTLIYQLKEIITANFIDGEGRVAQRVERYKRDSQAEPWLIKDVWHSVRTTRTAEKVEEDVRFYKMSFPVDEFKVWDGNAYNQEVKWEYHYDSIDYSSTVGTIYYDSLVSVIQREEYNFVAFEQAFETYAKHIGLVQKHVVDLDVLSGSNFAIPPVLDSIVKGVELYQIAIDYGNN